MPDGEKSILENSIFLHGSNMPNSNTHDNLLLPFEDLESGAGTLKAIRAWCIKIYAHSQPAADSVVGDPSTVEIPWREHGHIQRMAGMIIAWVERSSQCRYPAEHETRGKTIQEQNYEKSNPGIYSRPAGGPILHCLSYISGPSMQPVWARRYSWFVKTPKPKTRKNTWGQHALIFATAQSQPGMAKLQLAYGTGIHQKNKPGSTALHGVVG